MTKEYRGKRAGKASLVDFATIRFSASAAGFAAIGMLAGGCTVYDTGLFPASGQLMGDGATSGGGSGGGTSTGAKPTTAGTSGDVGGTFGSGGTDVIPNDGGADNAGGDSSTAAGGTAGTGAGAGGKAGAGGTSAGSAGKAGSAGASGNGGSGGTAPVVACADHPLPLKTTWIATASSSSLGDGLETDGLYNPPEHMTDGKYNERWASGKTQSGDEWIEIDFGVVATFTDLTLNVNTDTGDYPRNYAVRVSNKAQDFAAAAKASGAGAPGNTVLHFNTPLTGRYLNVRQTGVNTIDTAWWTIAEVLVGCTDP